MANPEHLAILKQGVEVWNEWRRKDPKIQPDLTRSDLKGMDLQGINFQATDLIETNLLGSNFSNANLWVAELSGAVASHAEFAGANISRAMLFEADLSLASLIGVNLENAIIIGTDLSATDLRGTNLTGAVFSKVNLTEATIGWTNFGNVDLGEARGLDTVWHKGPSTIGVDTIFRSRGKIPEVFLRGCGIQEAFIQFCRTMDKEPKDSYSCFISYSSNDQEFAKQLYSDLQDNGVRCWFAPKDLKTGDKFRNRIDEAIQTHSKLLLILSTNSINSSWVEKEVETAFEKEQRQQQTVLLPVRLDDAVMKTDQAWVADIRRMWHIGDFRGWEDCNQYQEAFAQLLRDLQAEEGE